MGIALVGFTEADIDLLWERLGATPFFPFALHLPWLLPLAWIFSGVFVDKLLGREVLLFPELSAVLQTFPDWDRARPRSKKVEARLSKKGKDFPLSSSFWS